jgi:alkanesulfonate monooxygenase SsuD/methylene tetrahydromethanopterin reductase-like flavin-dependent oxidoreductase (luciferase family)
LRVVAEHANIWNFTSNDVDMFRHKQNVLQEHCEAVGRNPDEIERSVQVRVDHNDLAATAAALQPLVDAGATHIILGLGYPYPEGIVARLADEVVARVG